MGYMPVQSKTRCSFLEVEEAHGLGYANLCAGPAGFEQVVRLPFAILVEYIGCATSEGR